MNNLEALIAAREYLSDEKNWCKETFAKYADKDGNMIDTCADLEDGAKIVSCCAIGAFNYKKHGDPVFGEDPAYALGKAASQIIREHGLVPTNDSFYDVAVVNDKLTHADVLRMFNIAIEIKKNEY